MSPSTETTHTDHRTILRHQVIQQRRGDLRLCAFAAPGDVKALVHKIKAGDVERLIGLLSSNKAKAGEQLGRSLEMVLCYEVGYDGFWLARLLIARGIRTVVFDAASFLMPRRGRRAKTDRLDAEGMTRTLRAWLGGDREVARDVQIPSVEQEDAKRIERERKYLIEERTSIVGRIKGLLALHGIWLSGGGWRPGRLMAACSLVVVWFATRVSGYRHT
jgi:transposase